MLLLQKFANFDIREIIFSKNQNVLSWKMNVGSWSYFLGNGSQKVIAPTSIGSMRL
jgi:hypothetical protein